jgi:hypothetical protein
MSLDWSLVAKLAEVVSTLGGLLLLWWKVRQIRELNAYVLLRFNLPHAICSRR